MESQYIEKNYFESKSKVRAKIEAVNLKAVGISVVGTATKIETAEKNVDLSKSNKKNMVRKEGFLLKANFNSIYARIYDFMREYMTLAYLAPAQKCYHPKFTYWLPHHPVEKKFHIVVKASAKTTSGESLNSIQMVKLQYDLSIQIMRFGKYEIGVATDISKMFNRNGLHPK